MRLVDGDEGRLSLGQHFGEARHAQPFGGDEQELQAAVQVVYARLARGAALTARMNALHCETPLLELCNLVFHQGDQRANHQRGSTTRDPRQLIAQRFARSGRHNQQHVFPVDGRLADRFLIRPEPGEAERAMEQR